MRSLKGEELLWESLKKTYWEIGWRHWSGDACIHKLTKYPIHYFSREALIKMGFKVPWSPSRIITEPVTAKDMKAILGMKTEDLRGSAWGQGFTYWMCRLSCTRARGLVDLLDRIVYYLGGNVLEETDQRKACRCA